MLWFRSDLFVSKNTLFKGNLDVLTAQIDEKEKRAEELKCNLEEDRHLLSMEKEKAVGLGAVAEEGDCQKRSFS